MNRHSALFCSLYSVSKQEEMSSSKNPSSKNCAEGNNSSVFVSDISNLSRYLLRLRFEEMKLIPYWIYVQLPYNRSTDIFLSYIIQNFSWISLDVELRVSFVPVCIIILVGSFHIIGMIWWVKSPTVEPGKRLTLTSSPCPHKFSTTIPFSIESPTMAVVPISHWSFSADLFFSPVSLLTLCLYFSYSSFFSCLNSLSCSSIDAFVVLLLLSPLLYSHSLFEWFFCLSSWLCCYYLD